ncbi:MAG: zinc dependent phospholipase C family protein [Cytophagales bacterium]|nr:zinc dependent phospholipase C family protein [Cytophagales bacterium]MDW8384721.1 zinc dependent phospholipase C family protein [Flammeovirgaceae bacterium]
MTFIIIYKIAIPQGMRNVKEKYVALEIKSFLAMQRIIVLCLFLMEACSAFGWGFFGHRRINRMAVFTLPPEMITFYKHHISFLVNNSVNPDQRRYAVKGEAERHYIDLDIYGKDAYNILPHRWTDAVKQYTEDTLKTYGIVPWHIEVMKVRLTNAFRRRDVEQILKLSAEIGHYIGDCNVPLHTTHNYNGQYTNQYGIHGFWESRCVELFSDDYDYFMERAHYIENTQEYVWDAVKQAHTALDSVFRIERELTLEMGEDKKWSFEARFGRTIKTYSYEFAYRFHERLNGQIERQMRRAIQMVGDFWYTCWVDGGKPDLDLLLGTEIRKEFEEENEKERDMAADVELQKTVRKHPESEVE